MQALLEQADPISHVERERAWPLDARMAMFVLEAGGSDPQAIQHRTAERVPCRIVGTVCEDDPTALAHAIVYVRDANDGHLGFICQSDLPVGKILQLNFATPRGQSFHGPCRIGRSRPFMTGWNEGVLELSGD
jgi:hypothetical protein